MPIDPKVPLIAPEPGRLASATPTSASPGETPPAPQPSDEFGVAAHADPSLQAASRGLASALAAPKEPAKALAPLGLLDVPQHLRDALPLGPEDRVSLMRSSKAFNAPVSAAMRERAWQVAALCSVFPSDQIRATRHLKHYRTVAFAPTLTTIASRAGGVMRHRSPLGLPVPNGTVYLAGMLATEGLRDVHHALCQYGDMLNQALQQSDALHPSAPPVLSEAQLAAVMHMLALPAAAGPPSRNTLTDVSKRIQDARTAMVRCLEQVAVQAQNDDVRASTLLALRTAPTLAQLPTLRLVGTLPYGLGVTSALTLLALLKDLLYAHPHARQDIMVVVHATAKASMQQRRQGQPPPAVQGRERIFAEFLCDLHAEADSRAVLTELLGESRSDQRQDKELGESIFTKLAALAHENPTAARHAFATVATVVRASDRPMLVAAAVLHFLRDRPDPQNLPLFAHLLEHGVQGVFAVPEERGLFAHVIECMHTLAVQFPQVAEPVRAHILSSARSHVSPDIRIFSIVALGMVGGLEDLAYLASLAVAEHSVNFSRAAVEAMELFAENHVEQLQQVAWSFAQVGRSPRSTPAREAAVRWLYAHLDQVDAVDAALFAELAKHDEVSSVEALLLADGLHNRSDGDTSHMHKKVYEALALADAERKEQIIVWQLLQAE